MAKALAMTPEQRKITKIVGNLLHLEDVGGNPTSLNVADNVVIWNGSVAGKFADLKEGDIVTLTGNPATVVVVGKAGV